jgi:hypothetical protein
MRCTLPRCARRRYGRGQSAHANQCALLERSSRGCKGHILGLRSGESNGVLTLAFEDHRTSVDNHEHTRCRIPRSHVSTPIRITVGLNRKVNSISSLEHESSKLRPLQVAKNTDGSMPMHCLRLVQVVTGHQQPHRCLGVTHLQRRATSR